MIRDIVKDEAFLAIPSEPATLADLSIGEDLLDTLHANQDHCVGLAANMIGVSKQIIVFDHDGVHKLMFNPKIIRSSEPYGTEEHCLSLLGSRPTKRYGKIKVEYQTETFQTKFQAFSGWTAQIIQHEIDHCHGIII